MTGFDLPGLTSPDRPLAAATAGHRLETRRRGHVDAGPADRDRPAGAYGVPRELPRRRDRRDVVDDAVAVAVADRLDGITDPQFQAEPAVFELDRGRGGGRAHLEHVAFGHVGDVAQDPVTRCGAEVVVDDLDDRGRVESEPGVEPVVGDSLGVAQQGSGGHGPAGRHRTQRDPQEIEAAARRPSQAWLRPGGITGWWGIPGRRCCWPGRANARL